MIILCYLKIHKRKKIVPGKVYHIPYFNVTHLKQLHIKAKTITDLYNINILVLSSNKKSILVCLLLNFPRNLTHSNSKNNT